MAVIALEFDAHSGQEVCGSAVGIMVQKTSNASSQPIETGNAVPANWTGRLDNLVSTKLKRLTVHNTLRNRRRAVHLQFARSVGQRFHCSDCRGYNRAEFGWDFH
jgi:hypothetical protein